MKRNKKSLISLNIVSDGTPQGTFIETDNGFKVKNAFKIKWEICAKGLSKANIEFVKIPIKLKSNFVMENEKLLKME